MTGPEEIVARHGLVPHPEGGWFAETHRDPRLVETAFGSRPRSTRILFLLAAGQVSRLHRLRQDEVWRHEAGPGLVLHVLTAPGTLASAQVAPGAPPVTVPAGTWMGAEAPGAWALVSCTCTPGFAYEDLEFARAQDVLGGWPAHGGLIGRLVP